MKEASFGYSNTSCNNQETKYFSVHTQEIQMIHFSLIKSNNTNSKVAPYKDL